MFLVNVGAVAALTSPFFLALLVWRRRKGASGRELVFLAALYLYVLGVAHYTLLPFAGPGIAAQYRDEAPFLVNSNFVPLSGLSLSSPGTIRNIVLAVPWGFLVAALWRNRWGNRATLITCLAFGLIIELLQFLLGEGGVVRFRAVDVNDALLNALGAVAGLVWFSLTNLLYRQASGGEDLRVASHDDADASAPRSSEGERMNSIT